MSRPKALMAALHDWHAPLALGSHHIGRALVELGWDVAYVSNGVSPAQVARDPREFRRRLSLVSRKGTRDLDGHLWTTVPLALVTPHNAPLLRSRGVHRGWQRTTAPNLVRAVRAQGFGTVDLLYVDTPVQSFWLDSIDSSVSVARIMDRASGFVGVADEFLRMERELIGAADLVVYPARSIEPEIESQGPRRSMHLPNGVDFSHFAEGSHEEPVDLTSIPAPRAVYVGDIAKWFDFDLLNALSSRLPEVSFVLIGPDRLARERVSPRANVHILGSRPFSQLPAYLHNADLGLIPFDVQRFPDAVNAVHPLKLYEYMACGLPVVATRWQELELMASPAVLCRTVDEWAAAISEAIDEPGDPSARVEYARGADWSGRVASLLDEVANVTRER